MSKSRILALSLGLLGVIALAGAQSGNSSPAGYHVARNITIPGQGWDYLGIDTPARRLYVSAGNDEDVINVNTDKLVGTVPGPGTHGVAISDQDGHGFTSNGGNHTSTEFDLKTLHVIKTIALPLPSTDGIIYDAHDDQVWIFNHHRPNAQVAVLNAKTGGVIGTVTLPGTAAEFAAADDQGHVYDNLEDKSQELEIDAHTLKITHVWNLKPACEGPSGLAIDTASRRLFIGCHNGVMAIMNADNGKIVQTVPIGPGVDATRFDPGTKLAFSSNGGGFGANAKPATITVMHEDSPDHYTLVGNIPTESGARTMEVDTQTHTLYSVTAKFEPLTGAALKAFQQRIAARGMRGGRGFVPRRMVPGSFHLIVIPK